MLSVFLSLYSTYVLFPNSKSKVSFCLQRFWKKCSLFFFPYIQPTFFSQIQNPKFPFACCNLKFYLTLLLFIIRGFIINLYIFFHIFIYIYYILHLLKFIICFIFLLQDSFILFCFQLIFLHSFTFVMLYTVISSHLPLWLSEGPPFTPPLHESLILCTVELFLLP
jgi:hypothetical protein